MTNSLPMTWRTDTKPAWEMKRRKWAQLGEAEGAMLYYLGRDWCSGTGVITELGSFLGASASLMAKGLRENENWAGQPILHCYDLWEAKFGNMAEVIRERIDPSFPDGGDFLPMFWDQVGEDRDVVQIHKGDFEDATWDGSPIEMVFVDISKSPSLNRVVLSQFFSALRVGGLMVNQDFHNPSNIWVQVSMGPLMKNFTVVEPRANDSALFQLHTPLTVGQLADAGRYEDLSLSEKLDRLEITIDAFRDEDFTERYLELVKSRIYAEAGRKTEAIAVIDAVEARMGTNYDQKADFFWARRVADMRRVARPEAKVLFPE